MALVGGKIQIWTIYHLRPKKLVNSDCRRLGDALRE